MLQTISRLYQSVLRFKHQEQSIIVQPTFKEDSITKPPRKLKIITSFRNIPKHCKPTIPSINPVERCHCELSPVAVTAEVIEITSDWGAKVADFRWGFHEKIPKITGTIVYWGSGQEEIREPFLLLLSPIFNFQKIYMGGTEWKWYSGSLTHSTVYHTNHMIVRYFLSMCWASACICINLAKSQATRMSSFFLLRCFRSPVQNFCIVVQSSKHETVEWLAGKLLWWWWWWWWFPLCEAGLRQALFQAISWHFFSPSFTWSTVPRSGLYNFSLFHLFSQPVNHGTAIERG